jgi:hypothetical protein
MKKSIFYTLLFGVLLTGCTWHPAGKPGTSSAGPAQPGETKDASSGTGSAAGSASDKAAGDAAAQLFDTAKLKADIGSVISSMESGHPDTNKLKAAGSDILTTTSNVLSDSGIDKLYGNSDDPAAKQAAAMLKKYRDAMGITPAALDSIRKAAEQLKNH